MTILSRTRQTVSAMLQAHGSIDNSKEVTTLLTKLTGWVSESTAPMNAELSQFRLRRLFVVIGKAAIYTENPMTKLITHRMLAELFTHQQIIEHLQASPFDRFAERFKARYHPSKAFQAQQPRFDRRHMTAFFSLKGLSTHILPCLKASELMQIAHLHSSLYQESIQLIFSRNDLVSQRSQRSLIKRWLSSQKSWLVIKSAYDSTTFDKTFFETSLLRLINSTEVFPAEDHNLVYRILLSKLRGTACHANQSGMDSIIQQLATLATPPISDVSREKMIALLDTLRSLAPTLSPSSREKVITSLQTMLRTLDYAAIQSRIVPALIELLIPVSTIPDAILDLLLTHIHADNFQMLTNIRDKLSKTHLERCIKRFTSAASPSSLCALSRLTPCMSQDQLLALLKYIASETDAPTGKHRQLLKAISKHLGNTYPGWLIAMQTLAKHDASQSVYHTMHAELAIVPSSATHQDPQNRAYPVTSSTQSQAFSTLPDAAFAAYLEAHTHLMHGPKQDEFDPFLKHIDEHLNRLSPASIKRLYDTLVESLKSPNPASVVLLRLINPLHSRLNKNQCNELSTFLLPILEHEKDEEEGDDLIFNAAIDALIELHQHLETIPMAWLNDAFLTSPGTVRLFQNLASYLGEEHVNILFHQLTHMLQPRTINTTGITACDQLSAIMSRLSDTQSTELERRLRALLRAGTLEDEAQIAVSSTLGTLYKQRARPSDNAVDFALRILEPSNAAQKKEIVHYFFRMAPYLTAHQCGLIDTASEHYAHDSYYTQIQAVVHALAPEEGAPASELAVAEPAGGGGGGFGGPAGGGGPAPY